MDIQPRPSSLKLGIVLTLIGSTLLGTVGGAITGGVVGYTVATYRQPAPIILSASSTATPDSSLDVVTASMTPTLESRAYLSESEALVMAVERVQPATVSVMNQGRFGEVTGSGVIIDWAGYILTNDHVVEGGQRLEVVLADGSQVPAQIVGASSEYDLAIIKINADMVPAVATFGDSAEVKQGERVAAIGSALGDLRNTVTSGIISAQNRELGDLRGLLQTDTPINQGNSGGPLINLDGQVIGINVMIVRGDRLYGSTAEGLGFAIPSNMARMAAQQLIETGEVQVPYIGIRYEVLNPQKSMEYGVAVPQGVWIAEVLAGTPADKAGLQPQDVVVALDGQGINDAHPLPQQLLTYEVGDTVTLSVVRGQAQLEIPLMLGQRP